MAGQLMRAVWYESYGGGAAGLKHVEVPVPSPAKDEILLKIEAATVNPIDWKIQEGMVRYILPRKFPHIPLTDVAGEVVEVGSEVRNFKAGDKVVSYLSQSGGGLAEYAVAKASSTVARPPEVSAADGASLSVAGCTAYIALAKSAGLTLDKSGLHKNVLVTAASGGVGHYAVQLAKLGNIHVTATCGARNAGLIKSLGADEVLDYRTPEGEALRSPSGRKYDAVVHCGGKGLPWPIIEPNLSENGLVVDITPGPGALWTWGVTKVTFSKKKLVPQMSPPNAEILGRLVELARDGKIKTVVDSEFPLSKAEDAWARSIEGHATGKIIVVA